MADNRIAYAIGNAFRTTSISLSYSTMVLFLTEFLFLTTFPEYKLNTFNALRYFLYFIFGTISYCKYFPMIQWLLLQEEFRNFAFDWKISTPSIIIIGCCYSSLMTFPSEFIFLLTSYNVTFQEVSLRLLCGAPATIVTMAIFETFFFHRYFRGIFLNMLPVA